MRAEVSPVDGRELRYEWALNEDCHFSGGNTGRGIRANRSQLGSCIATVIVRDDESRDLGRGSGTFAATVSPAIARMSSKTAEAAEKIKAAKELARKNDFDTAIELADAAMKLDPKNAEASSLVATWRDEIAKVESVKAKSAEIEKLLKQGADQHTARLYTEALETFNRVLDIDAKNLDAFRQRAMAKRELNDLAGSLEDFSRVIDADPKNYRSFLGRAPTKERLDDLKGALADYDRAIQLNPKYANGYWYRGLLRVDRLKDYSGAVDDFSLSAQAREVATWLRNRER